MSLNAAIREAYATAANNVVFLETLQISNPMVDTMYLVRDRVNHNLTLENGEVKLFTATAFRFTLPAAGENGLQELNLAIDNADRRITDFVNAVKESSDPVEIKFRPYLSTDPTTPQMNPALTLYLVDIVITAVEVSGRATFADVLNRKFLTDIYSRRRFPAL